MRMKKCLSILLAVVIIATMITSLPITANAVEIEAAGVGDGTMIEVGSATELEAACDEINTNGGTYTISLTADIEEGHIEIKNKNAVVTVIGNGHTLTATRSTAVYVANGATVNLGNRQSSLIIKGDNQIHDENGLVYVLKGSTCNMYDKVTLKDNAIENHLGGGVTIEGGTFHMHAGTIENCGIKGGSSCYGGGVAVFVGGSFVMDGGIISNCFANSTYTYTMEDYYDSGYTLHPTRTLTACGGGVFICTGSSFTMNGGTISKNKAQNSTGGQAHGGGIALGITNNEMNDFAMGNPQSCVTINGGTITGNQADCGGGISASGYFYTYFNAVGTATPVGGYFQEPGLYVNGGIISENTAIDAGGGIFVAMLCPWSRGNGAKGAKTQIHSAEIINNTADNGAGIENFGYWTQMNIDGCTITGNEAASNGGGVIALSNDTNGYTSIKDTTIKNNTSGGRGAGVYYDAKSKLYISGADVIQNNKYNDKLNNLNILSVDNPVYVDGDLSGSQIGLSDPRLWDDGREDAATDAVSADKLTSGYKEHNPEAHPNEYFTSDHETWIVERTEKTITEKPDETTKYLTYTFKRHPVESIGEYIYHPYHKQYVYNAPYAGNKDQYDLSDIQKPELQNKSSLTQTDILDELKYRFETMGEYDVTGGPNQYQPSVISYTCKPKTNSSLASGPLSSITINTKLNDINNVYLTYSSSPLKLIEGSNQIRGGKVEYTANVQNQPYPGKLLLQISSDGAEYLKDDTYYRFSDNSTTTSVDYPDVDLLNPTAKPLYEYDKETGDISAKLIPISSETKYARKTTVETGTDAEVRLVRKKPDYHINNDDIIAASYNDNNDETDDDIFTDEVEAAIGKEIKVGDTIDSFFLIPEVAPTATNTCPYIFKGWYYDQNNENDTRPVKFGTDKYAKDIYAHWIKVDNVEKATEDTHILPGGGNTYGGFDLMGVQIRKERTIDTNFDYARMPGGMRFITSLSKKVVDEINALTPGTDNIEYGYVAATDKNAGWINYHDKLPSKLLYVDNDANGINTSSTAPNETYFDFANNVDCTSRESNRTNGRVAQDHRSYGEYLLYTLVVTYENENADKDLNVLARPYIHYTDANGLERVAYSDYNGQSKKLGGCYTNYNKLTELEAKA